MVSKDGGRYSYVKVISARYAKSCLYLGTIYRQLGWSEASTTFINKALKMYELMGEVEGKSYNEEIEKIKSLK